jgi:hypothetical protein
MVVLVVVVTEVWIGRQLHSTPFEKTNPEQAWPSGHRPTTHVRPLGAVLHARSSGTHWQNEAVIPPVTAIA